eukprot:m.17648 g.17648  ORF g.17648 m.17648 type:complete len:74 (-) comp7516_c0_seq1:969-1190(-)
MAPFAERHEVEDEQAEQHEPASMPAWVTSDVGAKFGRYDETACLLPPTKDRAFPKMQVHVQQVAHKESKRGFP